MRILIFKCLIFTLLIVLLLNVLFDPVFKDSNANSKTFNQFYELPKDSLDILILGSSHAKNAYFPRIIDSMLNTKTYNLSTGGQNYLTTNLLLDDVLRNTKPKLVIVDLFPELMRIPKQPKSKSSQLRVIDYTSLSLRKMGFINDIYKLKEMPSVLSETIRNHDEWYNRNWKKEEFPVNNKNWIFNNGYFNSYKIIGQKEKEKYRNFVVEYENFLKIFPSKKELKNFEKDYSDILETIEICKKNNVDILFVSAPYFDSFYRDGLNIKHFLINNYFSKREDINYLDFNTKFNELGLKFEDFWDKGHLNIKGSRKTSVILSSALDSLGYFKIKNPLFLKEELDNIMPRDIKGIQEKVNLSLAKQVNEASEKGVVYNVNHTFNQDISSENIIFSFDGVNRFIVFENSSAFSKSNLDKYYFLISKTVNESDLDKRPQWQLGSNKNKLHWEAFYQNTTIGDKNYLILMLDKKCEITNFDEVRIVLKNKKTKSSVGRPLVIKNVSIKK